MGVQMGVQKEISFLPFHAINEFMLDEYRLKVIRVTIEALPELPDHVQSTINKMTRKLVKVQGFRNSSKAPLGIKMRSMEKTFKNNPTFVATILSAWAMINSHLSQQIYELLVHRKWDILPIDAERSKLPGFLTSWPEGESFDTLHEAFFHMYPESQSEKDDISLMIVWLGGRLPYQFSMQEDANHIPD